MSMNDIMQLSNLIKQHNANINNDQIILDKAGIKKHNILYHEIKSIEAQYLQAWNKFNTNKAIFLEISIHLATMYVKYDKSNTQILKVLRPLHSKQTEITFKRIRLEQKLEKSDETVRALKKLYDEKVKLFNKRTHEEYNLSPPNTKLKPAQKEFLQMWECYKNNPNMEKQFLASSKEYVKHLAEINKVRNSKKIQSYHKMLHHNYLRRSILEDRLLAGRKEYNDCNY